MAYNREQAVRAYQRAVAFEPSQPNGYAGLADAAAMSGRLAEALAWYLEGLEQDPGHVHIMSIIGFVYMSLGDAGRAQLWFDEAVELYPDGPLRRFFSEFTPLVIRNEDPARLLEALRGIPSSQFPGLGSRLFRKAALQTGDLPGIEAFHRQHWPELFEPEPRVVAGNFDIAPEVAWILRTRGDHQAAGRLLGKALDVFEDPARTSIWPPDWARVMFEVEVLALQERNAEALAALRRVIDDGWRWDWWQIERDPTLTSIRDEPEFIAMLAEVKADAAAQLEQVRRMERDGELPQRASCCPGKARAMTVARGRGRPLVDLPNPERRPRPFARDGRQADISDRSELRSGQHRHGHHVSGTVSVVELRSLPPRDRLHSAVHRYARLGIRARERPHVHVGL